MAKKHSKTHLQQIAAKIDGEAARLAGVRDILSIGMDELINANIAGVLHDVVEDVNERISGLAAELRSASHG